MVQSNVYILRVRLNNVCILSRPRYTDKVSISDVNAALQVFVVSDNKGTRKSLSEHDDGLKIFALSNFEAALKLFMLRRLCTRNIYTLSMQERNDCVIKILHWQQSAALKKFIVLQWNFCILLLRSFLKIISYVYGVPTLQWSLTLLLTAMQSLYYYHYKYLFIYYPFWPTERNKYMPQSCRFFWKIPFIFKYDNVMI